MLSFGGAWSNHLHALAALGAEQGFETIGLVRGGETLTPTLQDAQRWGMRLERVSRSNYRRRADAGFLAELEARYAPCLVIPEGGGGEPGARGCADIARMLLSVSPDSRHVLLPVGTGTTLAGLVSALDKDVRVTGVSALKGAVDTEQRVQSLLAGLAAKEHAHWEVLHDFHCGGFARVSAELRAFILDFERVQRVALDPVALDPVYTAKTLFALHQLRAGGAWSVDEPALVVHTGGLQGRRGYSWLEPDGQG